MIVLWFTLFVISTYDLLYIMYSLYGLYIVYDLFYMVGITLIRTSLSVEGHKRTVGNLRHDVYILLININGPLSILGKVKKKISTKHSLTTQAYQI